MTYLVLHASQLSAVKFGRSFVLVCMAVCFFPFRAIAVDSDSCPISGDDARIFSEIASVIKKNYVNVVTDKQLFNSCVAGMARGTDARGQYFDSDFENWYELGAPLHAKLAERPRGGIGVEISTRGKCPIIESVIDGAPAQAAGLRPGDEILKIGDVDVQGMSLSQVMTMLRGNVGTSVNLTVHRSGSTKLLEFQVKREVVRLRAVSQKLIDGGYGYIRVTQILAGAEKQVTDALRAINCKECSALPDIILDLRDNVGGLFDGVTGLADVFLDDGIIVTTEGRTPEARKQYMARRGDLAKGSPMVVLVNRETAAGAEMITSALQENGRAVVVGTPTFGRDDLQTVFPLKSDGTAIKITTSRWLTPKGRSVRGRGVQPDVIVEAGKDPSAQDSQLEMALDVLRTANSKRKHAHTSQPSPP